MSHGLPRPNETEGIEPDMCLPILPTTYHPTNRQPLQPSTQLPFGNCYFHTLTPLAKVRVKTTWRRRNKATILESPEKAREFVTSGQDMCRRDEAKLDHETRGLSVPAEISSMNPIEATNGVDIDGSSHNNIQLEPRRDLESYKSPRLPTEQGPENDDASFEDCASTEEGEMGELGELFNGGGLFEAIFAQGFADSSIIAITNITYDLSLARGGDFSEPEEFFEEEACLKE